MSIAETSTRRWVLRFAVAFALAMPAPVLVGEPGRPLEYPKVRKADVVDDLHGVKVPDPYRWLEESAHDSEEVRNWITAQNKITFGWLGEIRERAALKARLTALWDYERFGLPYKRAGKYFLSRNDGLQNQNVLYILDRLDGTPRELLDPNKFSEDGTVALTGTDITEDGRLLAYGTAAKGSDWQEWKVRDIATGKDLEDHIHWVKWSGASWTKDGKGFFYSRYDEPTEDTKHIGSNYYHKLYYHRLGDPQSADTLVYERKDQKEWGFGGTVTDDGRYLIINVWKGTARKNMIFYKDLQTKDAPVVELINEFEAEYDFVDNDGPLFWFRTDLEAPRGRLVAIDTTKPDKAAWKTLIPQSAETLTSAKTVGDHFIASYLKDASSQVKVFALDGKPVREVPFPGLGSAGGFGGRRDDPETFYTFTNYHTPGTIFRYDVKSGNSSVFRAPRVAFDPADFQTTQIFYKSKDGTRIPMFITHRKGLKPSPDTHTLLYGYGGFNASMTPAFRPTIIAWMETGGVYAVANLRGGGEYGKEWHEAGMKLKKQNVFDDFIAAAEWLIENKYTSTPKLAIYGGSNGGLLVGACMTQRPDLFGAAVPAVGVMDMLRFENFTIGWAWASDYGSVMNEAEFKALLAYSPLHNLKAGTAYPPTFITTADYDDRVVPAHSFKFAAALQEAHSGPNPVLIRIQTSAGHGAGKPTSMQIDEAADMYAFLTRVLRIKIDDSLGTQPEGPKRDSSS